MNKTEAIEMAVLKRDVKYIVVKLDTHIKSNNEDSKENKKQQEKILSKLDNHMKIITKALEFKADKETVKVLWSKYDKINYKIAYASGAVGFIILAITLIIR